MNNKTIFSIFMLIAVIFISRCISQSPKCNAVFKDIQAKTNESYNISVVIYLAGSKNYTVSYTNKQIRDILNGTNEIWNNYGIQFVIEGNINRTFETTLDDETVIVGTKHHNLDIDGEELGEKIIPKEYHNKTNIIFIQRFACKSWLECWEGKRIDNSTIFSTKLVIISQRGPPQLFNWMKDVSNISWNLAHEMGHVLNNNDLNETSKEYNLMTSNSDIKENCHPTLLNQDQLEKVLSEAKKLSS